MIDVWAGLALAVSPVLATLVAIVYFWARGDFDPMED